MHQQQTQEELQRTVTQRMAQVGMLDRFVEVMAAVGEEEREEMFKRYEAEMPKELEEGYVAASRVAIEKAVREKGDKMGRTAGQMISLTVGFTLEESSKMFIWIKSHMSSVCWSWDNRTCGL